MAEENHSTATNKRKRDSQRGRKNGEIKESINQKNNHGRHFSSFFRIMIKNYEDSLVLPEIFNCEIGFSVNQSVFLRDCKGGSWKVRLIRKKDRFFLEEGWKTFVLDHSITGGEFLIFKYRGNSTFGVQIYGTSTLERLHFKEKSVNHQSSKKKVTFNDFDRSVKLRKCESSKKVNTHNLKETDEIDVKEEVIELETTEAPQLPLCIVVPYELVKKNQEKVQLSDFFSPNFVLPNSYKSEVELWIEMKESALKFLVSGDGICHIIEETLVHDIPCEMKNKECNDEIVNNDLHSTKKTGGMQANVKSNVAPSLKKINTEATTGNTHTNDIFPSAITDFGFSLTISEIDNWISLPIKLPAELVKVVDGRKVILVSDPSERFWPIFYYENVAAASFFHGWESFVEANKIKKGDRCEFKVVQGSEVTLNASILRV